jgi:release factor glutamine methyltransferase
MDNFKRLIERLKKETYKGEETEEFLRDAERLKNGEPYEYVLGHVDFCGAKIDLSYRPMIPRPETAFWVARAIEELKQKSAETVGVKPLRIADTFSGAGNVGVAILKHVPHATVDFFELDPNLKAQIEKNILLNNIDPSRTRVTAASDIQGLTGTYDGILAVPPYVPYDALPNLDPEMIDFEPHLAFFAHENGHEFHRILIEKGRDYLKDGGTLYMETDMDHNDWVRECVKNTAWSTLEFWPDPYGATPNVVLRK